MLNKAQIYEVFPDPSGAVDLITSWPPSDTAWVSGGPLAKYIAISGNQAFPGLPWNVQAYNSGDMLDMEYVYRHSGSKVCSPFLTRGRIQEGVPYIYTDDNGVTGVPNYTQVLKWAMNPIVRFIPKWRSLWEDLLTVQSIDRLTTRNYSVKTTGTETETTDYGKVDTLSGTDQNTKDFSDSTTETPSGFDTLTIAGTITDKTTPTGSDKTVRSGTVKDESSGTTAVYGYGFNTASGADDPGKKNQRNGSEAHNTKQYDALTDTTTPGVVTTNDRTYTNYTETNTKGATNSTQYHSARTDDTTYGKRDTLSGSDTVTRTPNLVIAHTGYDGKSSVLLLEELYENSDVFDFFNNIVFRDLDRLFTLRVY